MFPNLTRAEPHLRDSTAVTRFQECPRKYFYSMVLGYKKDDDAPWLSFGNAYHKFREVLELHWLADPSLANSPDYVIAALERATKYFKKHHKPIDKGSKWEFMNIDRLTQSCMLAAQHWLREKKEKRIIVLAIEQPFQIQLDDGEIIAGRFDQTVDFSGKIWGRDFKTSSKNPSYYASSLSPNDQFTRYTYAENKLVGWDENDQSQRPPVSGQLIEVIFGNKTLKPIIETYPAQRTKEEMLTWKKEQLHLHKLMRECREEDVWPMNTKSCNFCEYRKVCSASSESMQQSILKNNYRHEPWDCTHSSKEDE